MKRLSILSIALAILALGAGWETHNTRRR